MHQMRAMIEIDEEKCDGCGLCVPSCHEGALVIRDGKARLVADQLCDGLGACLGECPQGALKVIQREAVPFVDPHAPAPAPENVGAGPAPARAGQSPAPTSDAGHAGHAGGGCPGAQMRTFTPLPTAPAPPSELQQRAAAGPGHWPVQVGLVPPHAPFLQDAALLVTADCVPVAMPTFHADLLAGHAVMMGCPKFDDLEGYTDRFFGLFTRSSVRSVTVAVMEVPCCQGLPAAVLRAREAAGSAVPVEIVTIGVDGREQSRRAV